MSGNLRMLQPSGQDEKSVLSLRGCPAQEVNRPFEGIHIEAVHLLERWVGSNDEGQGLHIPDSMGESYREFRLKLRSHPSRPRIKLGARARHI